MDPSKLVKGNNVTICVKPDSLAEAERIIAALGDGGNIEMPIMEVSAGDHFGTVIDKFGLDWMVQYTVA
jgi:PhnB protein